MTVTTGWDLFEDLLAGQDEAMRTARGRARRHGHPYDADAGAMAWAPAIEISERKDAYMVSGGTSRRQRGRGGNHLRGRPADDPGRAARRAGRRRGEGHRSERYYGAFRRSITLPGHVQAGKIEATAQDGMLTVLVPKAPDVQAKRIPVQAGRQGRGHARRDGQRELTISRPWHRPTAAGDHDPPAVTAARSGDGESSHRSSRSEPRLAAAAARRAHVTPRMPMSRQPCPDAGTYPLLSCHRFSHSSASSW